MAASSASKPLPKPQQFDKYFFLVVVLITVWGLLSFISASLGILASNETKFYGVLFNQIVLGFMCGLGGLWLTTHINYHVWRSYALHIFIGTVLLTLCVFVPHLGFSHGGARRWVSLGPVSFQPAELLKIGFVIYFAGWLSWASKKSEEFKYKIVPLAILLSIVAAVLLKQPDTKSLVLITAAASGMLFVSGVSWKKIAGIAASGLVLVCVLALFRPYLMNRVKTFLNPDANARTSSYQLQQGLIAIGSGGMFGRGLGQSVQKFNYLPEPQGDSIYAVIGEEFGFVGSTILVFLYVVFAIRGYRIAMHAYDPFGQYLAVGIVTLLIAQSFLNIASLVGLFPLTGVPLVFISHGGTSLAIALCAAGIVLNISRYQKR